MTTMGEPTRQGGRLHQCAPLISLGMTGGGNQGCFAAAHLVRRGHGASGGPEDQFRATVPAWIAFSVAMRGRMASM